MLAYDTARVLVEGLFRAPILSGPGLKTGLESIRFLPSTTGGATRTSRARPTSTACSAATGSSTAGSRGELEFEGLFEPWE